MKLLILLGGLSDAKDVERMYSIEMILTYIPKVTFIPIFLMVLSLLLMVNHNSPLLLAFFSFFFSRQEKHPVPTGS